MLIITCLNRHVLQQLHLHFWHRGYFFLDLQLTPRFFFSFEHRSSATAISLPWPSLDIHKSISNHSHTCVRTTLLIQDFYDDPGSLIFFFLNKRRLMLCFAITRESPLDGIRFNDWTWVRKTGDGWLTPQRNWLSHQSDVWHLRFSSCTISYDWYQCERPIIFICLKYCWTFEFSGFSFIIIRFVIQIFKIQLVTLMSDDDDKNMKNAG